MADFNEDIIINVRSDTKQAVRDINAFDEALKKMQSTMQKTEVSTKSINKWVKQLENVANPIEFANKQMDRLNKKLAKAQGGVEVKRITKDQVALMTATGQSESFQSAYRQESGIIKAQQALAEFERRLDPTKEKLYQLQQKLEASRDEFVKLASSQQNTSGAEQAIKKITKQMQKLEESTKKSAGWISKLMGRIRNISIYRMIRSGIKWLTSGVSEGLQGLAIYNNEVNKSMSNINNSLGQIKNTLAISFASVLQALEPTITALSDALVDLINSFNLAMAKMQGKDFYTKAKKSADAYAKSAQKAQKLSFDTFEVLSGGDDKTPTQDLFEDGSVAEDANEISNAFEHIFRISQEVWDVVKEIIQDLKESGVLCLLLDIVGVIAQIAGDLTHLLIPVIKSVLEQVQGALQIIYGFLKLLTGDFEGAWNLIGNGFASMCNGIINLFVQLAGGIVKLLNLLFVKINPFFWILKAFGIDVGQKIDNWTEGWSSWRLNWKPIKGYYNGGVPAQGDLFYMNEHGPEALVNTGGSQTNVINIDQLSEGMRRGFVQAIYDTGMLTAMQQGSSTIVVDKDVLGRTVAESAGFRNEVNRRNVSLNLR